MIASFFSHDNFIAHYVRTNINGMLLNQMNLIWEFKHKTQSYFKNYLHVLYYPLSRRDLLVQEHFLCFGVFGGDEEKAKLLLINRM